MNVNDPTTWHSLSAHPTFSGGEFDPSWYDGDVDADLAMLRQVAIAIAKEYPGAKSELFALDDCTIYVSFDIGNGVCCEVFTTLTDSNQSGYYVDIEGTADEVRVASASEVIDALSRAPGQA